MKKYTGLTPAMVEAEVRGLGAAAGTPGAIEASELAGQIDMATLSNRLPIESNVPKERIAEVTGIVFGKPVDELFVSVTLPARWVIRPTEHAMWSGLLNGQGERVAGIFYKAAFYDRKAWITWDVEALHSAEKS